MKNALPVLSVLTLSLGLAALPVQASSTASTAIADSIAASVGSVSDSVRGSSNSSSRATGVAEGDYRLIDVAERPGEPGKLRLSLQGPDGEGVALQLDVPQQAFDQSGLATGQFVTARHRAYGIEFSNTQTKQAFFLALDDAAYRELGTRAVTL